MNNKLTTEIEKAAQKLNMPVDEVTQKFESIMTENNVDFKNDDNLNVCLGLFRGWFYQQTANRKGNSNDSGSLFKPAFGFFATLGDPRGVNTWKIGQHIAAFERDEDDAYDTGRVALCEQVSNGWKVSRMDKGDEKSKVFGSLPSAAVEVNGTFIIPLDEVAAYPSGVNRNYGKPLDPNLMKIEGVFVGSVGEEDMQKYYFSYKGKAAEDFRPPTFEWIHLAVIQNDNRPDNIYGGTSMTLDSLQINKNLDPEGPLWKKEGDITSAIQEHLDSNIVSLTELDDFHGNIMDRNYGDRFVVTDGLVVNMNMTPLKNGNRILSLSSLEDEFDTEAQPTTCWIPSSMQIDFGIGSQVIVAGRTSQRDVDGELQPATINVAGLLVTEAYGSAEESTEVVEENYDWF
tara:strand:+ start:6128 stop:7330 length:1203 start_codon:yes stop_codon:yes gene_type:complete